MIMTHSRNLVMVLAIRPVVVLLFAVVLLRLLFVVVVMMMMMIGLFLLFLALRVVGCRTPSAAANLKKSDAKSDLPPRGRTMTRSASRAASRGGSPQAADNVKIAAAAAAAHYQPLDAKYPDRVRAPSVSRR